jgi:hypothetical protein
MDNIFKIALIALLSGIFFMLFRVNESLADVNSKIPQVTLYTLGELQEKKRKMFEEAEKGPAHRSYNAQTVFQVQGDVDVTGSVDIDGGSVDVSGSTVEVER